ncbi:MAG: hypothetical protein LT105_03120 [Lentimicrobium sp.]|nr:hypothetical protein [Lentimicrobium sp.]
MKEKTKIALVMVALLTLFTTCKKNEMTENDPVNSMNETQLKTELIWCGSLITLPMVDYQQTMAPAILSIGNDETQLLIKYQVTDASWYVYNAALYAGTPEGLTAISSSNVFNPDGSGIFNPGSLPNQSWHSQAANVQYREYLYDLSTLPECFVIVAYMQLRNAEGQSVQVWGKSASKSAGYYINYCVQQCETPPPLGGCETAYAYGEATATCFLNIAGVNSNNWGWSNGPIGAGSYSWPMYAGAGQCNIGNGTHVGTLTVNYTPPTATVTYTVFDIYRLSETHLHIGNTILPVVRNRFTTAPGQFPYVHGNLGGVISDTYNITGLSGNIYVAAHSVVCDAQ